MSWLSLIEGIVSKRLGSRYVSGRTRAWLKTKKPSFERWRAALARGEQRGHAHDQINS